MLSHAWLFCKPMDCSLPGSSVHGVSQARVLEQVAIFFSKGSSLTRDQTRATGSGSMDLNLDHQGSPESISLVPLIFFFVFVISYFDINFIS